MATTTTMPQPLPLPSARGHKFLTCVPPVLPVPPRGHKFSTCVSPVLPSAPRGHKFSTCGIRRAPRSAFTLVELLVVIGIISLLAAIVTPAVMRAQSTARNAAIKAEIDMLHMAIMNYKNEYGSFPPCDGFDLTATCPSTKHLQRLFPRCANPLSELQTTLAGTASAKISPSNAITFWLSGYTDTPSAPLTVGSRKKQFDFDTSRVDASTGYYWPAGKSSSWYVYIDSSAYLTYPYAASSLTSVRAQRVPTTPPTTNSVAEFTNTSQPFANPDTFQILCAGRDEVFGNDDDLSNFWPGTRRDYLDSLNK